jgi:transcription antitermination protein NusB
MATRRMAREWAVQVLFGLDLNPAAPETVLAGFWREREADATARAFTERAVRGVMAHRDAIDACLAAHAEHWDVARMGVIERNVMRLALYELMYCPDIPAAVTINEAVDIAKYFSSTESGRFVNGILDRARKELGRQAR